MSDCCNVNQTGESCAAVLTENRSEKDFRCAECRVEGRPVEQQTVLHHVQNEQLDRVNGEAYRFCSEPNCPIVYYGDKGAYFTVDDLRELVTTKTQGDKRPICYCFGFTEGDARDDIARTGATTIPTTISRLIKSGMCACEVRNPSGACCLGEVTRTVKRLSDEHEASMQETLAPAHECCAR